MTTFVPAISCPVCRSERTRLIVRWRDPYRILVCDSCGLRFADPLPSEEQLKLFYQGFMFRKPARNELDSAVTQRQIELRVLFGEGRGRTFLDFGGGTGATVAAARSLGFDAYYYDIDTHAREFARETFELPANRVIYNDIPETARFDCILMDNVIEHLLNPASILNDRWRNLAPGGILAVSTPRAASTDAWFQPAVTFLHYTRDAQRYGGLKNAISSYTHRSWYCDPPRHLWSFTPSAFRALTQSAGIPENQLSIAGSYASVWDQTVTRATFIGFTKSRSLRTSLARIALFPVVLAEILVKPLQICARACGLITPEMIIATIRRPVN